MPSPRSSFSLTQHGTHFRGPLLLQDPPPSIFVNTFIFYIIKKIIFGAPTNPKYSLEGIMPKLMLQYFGHLMWRADPLEKTMMLGNTEDRRRRGTTEDEMVGWHHWLNGPKFEQILGDSEGQGSLVCCSPWGCKELDTTEQQQLWHVGF